MPTRKRLVVQEHHIDADTTDQADKILTARVNALRTALRPLGHEYARVLVINADDAHDGLDDLLSGLYVADEIDDGGERNPYPGWVPAETTDLRERLLAWRDATVHAILAEAARHSAALLAEAERAVAEPEARTAAAYRIRETAGHLHATLAGIKDAPEPKGPRFEPMLDEADPRFRGFPWVLRDNTTGQAYVPVGALGPTHFTRESTAWREADRLNRGSERETDEEGRAS